VQRGRKLWRLLARHRRRHGSHLPRLPVLRVHHFIHEGLTLQHSRLRIDLLRAHRIPRRARDGGRDLDDDAPDQSLRGKLTPDKALQVEIAGLYWHFVDIVWIVIFVLVYLIP
jgi:hypothetical protein